MSMFNVLETALSLLPAVTFKYRTFLSSEVNELGVAVSKYSEWKTCRGMVQPVEESKYAAMGLTFGKRYITVWGSVVFNTLSVQENCDQVLYDGCVFNCERVTGWRNYNGWNTTVCCEDKRERGKN